MCNMSRKDITIILSELNKHPQNIAVRSVVEITY